MKLYMLLCVFLLTSCASRAPSQAIVENTRKEIISVQETLKKIELQTPIECKTEVFIANLDAIKNQISSIDGRIESIGQSCRVEKEVLEERITVREMAIACLMLIIVGLGFVLIRRK